jgi:hypothetical protein
MTFSKRSCNHPLFKWASESWWNNAPAGLKNPCVFVFERSLHIEPTEAQVLDYRRRAEIVQRLGGRMCLMEYEIAGENPPLSIDDAHAIKQAVLSANPDAVFVESWNGAGCYTMSVGVDLVGGSA